MVCLAQATSSASVSSRAGGTDDERLDLLAVDCVRHADDRGQADRRVGEQDLFELARVDVEAAPDDHVLLAVHDVQVAVGVAGADVAGAEPAVASIASAVASGGRSSPSSRCGRGSRSRRARRRRPPSPSLADHLDLDAPDRAGRSSRAAGPVHPVERGDGAGLRQAVALQDGHAEPLLERRITSTGSAAPPERRPGGRRSSRCRTRPVSSQLSSAWYMVGTPAKKVTCSACISSSTVAASNRGSSTIVAPAANPAFICTIWPKEWNSGSTSRCTSCGCGPNSRFASSALCTMLLCVSSAPLGCPVVPLV